MGKKLIRASLWLVMAAFILGCVGGATSAVVVSTIFSPVQANVASAHLEPKVAYAAVDVEPEAAASQAGAAKETTKEVVLPFRGVPQTHNLSCESAGAASLTSGVLDEHIILQELGRSDDPDKGFVGSPDAPVGSLYPDGYGVHAGPLVRVLNNHGYTAKVGRGQGIAWLREKVQSGMPVLIWAVWKFQTPKATGWTTADGKWVKAFRKEHTYVVYGVRPGAFLVYNTNATTDHPASLWVSETQLAKSWALFNNMAMWLDGGR